MRVAELSKTMGSLTSRQMEWGFAHCMPDRCVFNTKRHTASCINCGHEWNTDAPCVCPSCGRKLDVLRDSRIRRFNDIAIYDVVQRKEEFIVVRQFFLSRSQYKGKGTESSEVMEVVQHWIDTEGRHVIVARNLSMCPYYRTNPFMWSEMSIKRESPWNGYYYHMMPKATYIRRQHYPLLRRNGFDGDFRNMKPEYAIRLLLKDNRFETLWKLRMDELALRYANGDSRITKYWKAVMLMRRYGYEAEVSLWLDYLDLLDYFNKDLTNHAVVLPNDLKTEHDRLMDRKQKILDAERERERRERQKEKIRIFNQKSGYFGIRFGDDTMDVIVLSTIDEYKREGEVQHHCVYTNEYYAKPDSLILSARKKTDPDKPVETIEVSLKDGRILQCFGKFNRMTEYHQRVMDLVDRNIGLVIGT